jgi:two-component system NtrC family sensor kinase
MLTVGTVFTRDHIPGSNIVHIREAIGLPRLILSRKGERLQELELGQGIHVIGRDASCDIVLDDKTVSRQHARITVDGDSVTVEDLESRNGTFIAGKRIRCHTPGPGDMVSIGAHDIVFEAVEAAAQGSADQREEAPGRTAIITAIDARSVGTGEDLVEGAVAGETIARRLSGLYELGQKLCGRLSASEIAETFLDVVFEVFPRADRAVMLLEDAQTRQLEPLAIRERKPMRPQTKVSRTVVKTVLDEKRAVICGDTSTDARFKDSMSLQDLMVKSIMCVPLLVTEKVLGMVELDSGGGGITFRDDDLRLLTALASQVSIAIENGRLYGELEGSRRLAAIGQTVSGVAHCVKNVLNGIDGGLFIARRGLDSGSDEKVSKGWDMLERNSSFLKALVLDMLDYSKDRPPEYVEMTLDPMFDEMRAFVEGRAAEGGIDLSFDLDSAIGRVRLDATRMKRALLNIVSNAIEATPEGGKVTISAVSAQGGRFVIAISDTGKGIPPEMVETIFEPFYSTKGSKGTGLGLPVTKKIIQEHDGRVEGPPSG